MTANAFGQRCRTMLNGILWKRHALGLAVAAAFAGRRLGIGALGRLLPTTTSTPSSASTGSWATRDSRIARRRCICCERSAQLRLTKALRVERMLLVAAVVHLLAMLVGGEESGRRDDRSFRANTERKKPAHSSFTLGLFFAAQLRWKRSELLPKFWAEAIAELGG